MTTNTFRKSLNNSNGVIPHSFYLSIFGSGSRVESVTDLTLQKVGADIKVTLKSGDSFYVEEKIRLTTYPDLLLETKSSIERNTPGWIEKESISEWLVYFCKDTKRIFVMKMKDIQTEYNERKTAWLDRHRIVTSSTDNLYHSRNVAVPWSDIRSKVFTATLN